MVLFRHAKWMYAVASSSVALGVYNYMQPEKKFAQASWTTNFQPSVKWDHNWDKRDLSSLIKPPKNDDVEEQNRINEEKEKLKPTSWRHILLIRHGQYTTAKKPEDKKLTELGRKQADYVGKRLKELGKNYTKLTTSTMIRAMETSDIILKYFPGIPTESDDLLQEGAPVPPEPPSNYKMEDDYVYFEDGARIEAAFRKYFHRADASEKSPFVYEIIVCHANVIRYFLCRVLQLSPEAWLRFELHHCSMTWIVIPPDGEAFVNVVGDFGFLPKDAISIK